MGLNKMINTGAFLAAIAAGGMRCGEAQTHDLDQSEGVMDQIEDQKNPVFGNVEILSSQAGIFLDVEVLQEGFLTINLISPDEGFIEKNEIIPVKKGVNLERFQISSTKPQPGTKLTLSDGNNFSIERIF